MLTCIQIYILDDYFDWALDEQCYQYKECDTLKPFLAQVHTFYPSRICSYPLTTAQQNKAVFGAEYKGNSKKVCNALNNMGYSFIRTDLNVDATSLVPCCSYANPPCPLKPAYCVPPPADYPVYPDDVGSNDGARVSAMGVVMVLVALLLVVV